MHKRMPTLFVHKHVSNRVETMKHAIENITVIETKQ